MKEEVEIIPGPDGVLVARAIWGNHMVEEKLPKGFETWPEDEQVAHMRRFVAPKLKAMMTKSRAGLLPVKEHDGIIGYRAPVPKTERQADRLESGLTELDRQKLAKAQAKRERKLRVVTEAHASREIQNESIQLYQALKANEAEPDPGEGEPLYQASDLNPGPDQYGYRRPIELQDPKEEFDRLNEEDERRRRRRTIRVVN